MKKKSYSKWSKNEPVCMCKEGWCARLGQEEGTVYWRVGGTVRNTLRWGGIKKRGRKIFFFEKAGARWVR